MIVIAAAAAAATTTATAITSTLITRRIRGLLLLLHLSLICYNDYSDPTVVAIAVMIGL